MNAPEIAAALDAEIARLQQARNLIAQFSAVKATTRLGKTRIAVQTMRPRVLSPEARKKIATAQRRRWAKQKSAKKAAPLGKAAKAVRERGVLSVKETPAKTPKSAKKVHVTKVPAKTRSEKKTQRTTRTWEKMPAG